VTWGQEKRPARPKRKKKKQDQVLRDERKNVTGDFTEERFPEREAPLSEKKFCASGGKGRRGAIRENLVETELSLSSGEERITSEGEVV